MEEINRFKHDAAQFLRNSIQVLTEGGDLEAIITRLESFLIAAEDFVGLDATLEQSAAECENALCILLNTVTTSSNLEEVQPVGRPQLNVDTDAIEALLSMNFRGTEVAKMLGISVKTIQRRLKDKGLSIRKTYSSISDGDLADAVATTLGELPNTGYKRMRGYLLNKGIKVPELRVRQVMRDVDPEGVMMRRAQNHAIVRRQYYVHYSNSLWHLDTNLKLSPWKMVIRGAVDGKSRFCVYLEIGTDNRADTHLIAFRKATRELGVPSRCRSDKGGENIDIARYMLQKRGLNRGSHICGRSIHNERIERYWRDVTYGCTALYKRLFLKLEYDGLLNADDDIDLTILQYIMLPRINRHLATFRDGHNMHPVSTERNKSPLQLFTLHVPPPYYDMDDDDNDSVLPADWRPVDNENDMVTFNHPNDITSPNLEGALSQSQISILSNIDPLVECDDYGYALYVSSRILVRGVMNG